MIITLYLLILDAAFVLYDADSNAFLAFPAFEPDAAFSGSDKPKIEVQLN